MSGTANICTWIYGDLAGEESKYLQVVGQSSSAKFLFPYWRCLIIYFASSIKHNPNANHILFTNLEHLPTIDGFDVGEFFSTHGIKVVNLPLTYRTPKGYHGAWRNQFYIFDILNYISRGCADDDKYLILDSDCIWIKPADSIFRDIEKYGLLTYDLNLPIDYPMNGLSRLDMMAIFKELDHPDISDPPEYFGGEWFGASGREINRLASQMDLSWKESISRFEQGKLKFNEEAHLLSYLYHQFDYAAGTANPYIKQIWTARRYHNAKSEDFNLTVWHVPAEKLYGFKRLFKQVRNPKSPFWALPPGEQFAHYVADYLGLPRRNLPKLTLDAFDYGIVWAKRNLISR